MLDYDEILSENIRFPGKAALVDSVACASSDGALLGLCLLYEYFLRERVYVFQHFSMNRFTIDLADFVKAEKKEKAPLESNIHELGLLHRKEIFGS